MKKITATQLTHNTRMVIREVTQLKQPVLVMSYNLPIAIISPYEGTDVLTEKAVIKKKRPSLNELEKFFIKNPKLKDSTKIIRKLRDGK